jgi:flagellar FliL protein
MAAKSETPAPADATAPTATQKGGAGNLMPAILAIVVAPALTFAVAQFVLIPKLRNELAAAADPQASEATHAAPAPSSGSHGGSGPVSPANGYTFDNIVVNLAGTMGTRYLKTTFLVTGSDSGLAAAFDARKPQLVDVTLNVLSSLSLADLEEAGAKNLIREKLIQSYNQVFGRKVAEQVFFSDFVVQ